ncbi:glycoside hydrolase family 38 C-terminal domain-containing protein [Virgibacillus sp. Bac330]|uniref:glycoside hydrolase family 38 N-terminal domain-containing protein n=1 Tax=Virgibacillus sp. Bac330 TaxID=2419841 RepID=UPI000EF45DF7|nr:glycoside hydrolase family 38 C-terminal domain-containing protein [Virgibacillus sp. Bac330]
MKKRVYVVPHSHWDREWYFTIEDSNVLLVENMDYLIDVLENDTAYTAYVFDAQVSIVEEYLSLRPEQEERLKKLVADKRLFIGPWYTQTDSLLVHKESIIRNLLYGTKISQKYGHSMNCGYLPDIFGQNQYFPSIFTGFGIDNSILQRGVYTDQLKGDLNFTWISPDKKKVKANNMYFGYGPGKFLQATEEYKESRLYPILEKLSSMNRHTDQLLLPSGGDQVLIRKHFPETIQKLNKETEDYEFLLSDYETYMKDTWGDYHRFDNEIEGELIATQNARIHHTIRSQRYDIKKANYEVEHKLLHQLEPLAVIGHSFGLRYPQEWLDKIWKLLFDVHAHDSIGGCNSDDTNKDIIQRLQKVKRIADGLLNIWKKRMTEAISSKQHDLSSIFVFFNTNASEFSGVVEAVIFTKSREFILRDTVEDTQVMAEVKRQKYVSGGKQIIVTAEGEQEVEIPGYYRNSIMVAMDNVPSLGYKTLKVEKVNKRLPTVIQEESTSIANEQFEIKLKDGQLIVTDKKKKIELDHFLRFENVADAGDSYDFSPLDGDKPIYLEQAELISVSKGELSQFMVVKHEALVPKNLKERTENIASKLLMITTTLELRKEEHMVRVKHDIANEVEDHRVRVLLQTGAEHANQSFADQGFSIIQRPITNSYMKSWREDGFTEAPVPIYPLENFTGNKSDTHIFAAVTRGIKEYELLEFGDLALTLYRSVGLLGKDNLAWRPGRASGINNKVVFTPDAQMKRKMTFEYAVVIEDSNVEPSQLFVRTDQYVGRYVTYQKQDLNTFEERLERFEFPMEIKDLPKTASILKQENPNILMSSCKRAYNNESIIIRFYNPTEKEQQLELSHVFPSLNVTNLAEDQQLEVNKNLIITPKAYLTLSLK